jgi:hypothetical protein
VAIGEESEVANAMEAVGQGVEQEAPDELVGLQTHGLDGAAVAIVLPGKGDMTVACRLPDRLPAFGPLRAARAYRAIRVRYDQGRISMRGEEASRRFGGVVAPTQGYQIHETGYHAPWLTEVMGFDLDARHQAHQILLNKVDL